MFTALEKSCESCLKRDIFTLSPSLSLSSQQQLSPPPLWWSIRAHELMSKKRLNVDWTTYKVALVELLSSSGGSTTSSPSSSLRSPKSLTNGHTAIVAHRHTARAMFSGTGIFAAALNTTQINMITLQHRSTKRVNTQRRTITVINEK